MSAIPPPSAPPPPGPPPQGPPPGEPAGQPSQGGAAGGDTTLAALAAASGIFTGFLGPLVFFLIKEDDPFVKETARAALNFQISYTIWFFISGVLSLLLIGLLFLAVLVPAWFVFTIIGAVKASNGELYDSYLLSLNLVK